MGLRLTRRPRPYHGWVIIAVVLLVLAYGWRAALQILAGIVALTVVPHALVLRHLPADLGLTVDGGAAQPVTPVVMGAEPVTPAGLRVAIKQRAFWLLALAFGMANLTFNGIAAHLMAYELARGQDATFAAWAIGLAGVLQVAGRLTVVPLGDRVPRRTIIMVMFCIQALAYAALVALPLTAGLLVHVILRGIGTGPLSPTRAALVAEMFGTERYGVIMGAMSFVVNMAGALSPVAIGVFVGVGGYGPVMWTFAIASLIGALAVSRVGRART